MRTTSVVNHGIGKEHKGNELTVGAEGNIGEVFEDQTRGTNKSCRDQVNGHSGQNQIVVSSRQRD